MTNPIVVTLHNYIEANITLPDGYFTNDTFGARYMDNGNVSKPPVISDSGLLLIESQSTNDDIKLKLINLIVIQRKEKLIYSNIVVH